jgi:hypothetical protein
MGRLKKDHTGWRTSGLWLKYKHPTASETQEWHKFQKMEWSWRMDDYVDPYIEIHCVECGKEKYTKTAKAANYPLHIWIDEKYCGYDPIQVRVNGEYKPLTMYDFKRGKYYCRDCGFCH